MGIDGLKAFGFSTRKKFLFIFINPNVLISTGLENVLFDVEICASIISVSGTSSPLLCPLGLSDPPFTSDKDEDYVIRIS